MCLMMDTIFIGFEEPVPCKEKLEKTMGICWTELALKA